jgi:NADH-quinone oxidoreductase subunit K
MYPISMFILTTVLMFVFGFIALILRRDLVRLLIGIEILFNAANLLFVALSTQTPGMVDPFPQSIVMMALVLDGTVIAVGLALALNVFKHYKTFDIKKLRKLKW